MDLRLSELPRDRPLTTGLSELSKVRVILALDNNTRSALINQHRLDIAEEAGVLSTSVRMELIPERTFWGGRMTAPTGGQSDAEEQDEIDRCRIRRANRKRNKVEYNAGISHVTRSSKRKADEVMGIDSSGSKTILSDKERLNCRVLRVPYGMREERMSSMQERLKGCQG